MPAKKEERPPAITLNSRFHVLEGLPGADTFSGYAGDLTTVSNLSQAVHCARWSPGAPERLTVAPTLPDPEAGDGSYYLEAERQGPQISVSRSMIGEQMQGKRSIA